MNMARVWKIGLLQQTVSREQASRAVVEEDLTNLKSSASASNALAVQLGESERLLQNSYADMVFPKEQVKRAGMETVDSDKPLALVREGLEQRMLRLNETVICRNKVVMLKP